MQEFLIILPLPEALAPSADRFARTAVAFLEAVGPVKRKDLEPFHRSTRGGIEVLHQITLTTGGENTGKHDVAQARSLEGVIRSALSAAKAPTSDVRVFARALKAPVS